MLIWKPPAFFIVVANILLFLVGDGLFRCPRARSAAGRRFDDDGAPTPNGSGEALNSSQSGGSNTRVSFRERGRSSSQFDEAGGLEVAVECQCLSNLPSAHHCEARCIDEGVFAFIVASEPPKSLCLEILPDPNQLEPGGVTDRVQKVDGAGMTSSSPQKRPCLSSNLV